MNSELRIVTMLGILLFIFLQFINLVPEIHAATSDDVSKLHDTLFKEYRKNIRPVRNQNHAIHVNLSFFIIMIHDLDLKNQVLTTNAWLRMSWKDEFLRWNKSDYHGLSEILVSRNEVWTPDLLVENTAFGYHELGIDEMLINVDSEGQLIWEPGIVMQTICEVNIAKYPFDSQHCAIRVMSWMYTNKSLHVVVERNTIDTTGYYPNGEWDLSDTRVKAYSPEDGSYNTGEILPGAEATIELSRRPVYYIISTILPISMLSLLNVLVFMLPTNTGEKMTLAVTVLLSFTVFMSVVNEVMPKTSNSVSILAVYLTILLTLSGLSVASTVMVLYFHHHANTYHYPDLYRYHNDDVVHNTRLYRIGRGSSFNNNRRKQSKLNKNGIKPPSSEELLREYMDVDSDAQQSSDNNVSCCTRLRRRCKRYGQSKGVVRQRITKNFAETLDRVLFCIVIILTIISTVIVMILLCS